MCWTIVAFSRGKTFREDRVSDSEPKRLPKMYTLLAGRCGTMRVLFGGFRKEDMQKEK